MSEWTGGVQSECPAIKELREALLDGVPLLTANPSKIGTLRYKNSCHQSQARLYCDLSHIRQRS